MVTMQTTHSTINLSHYTLRKVQQHGGLLGQQCELEYNYRDRANFHGEESQSFLE